jgi:hypothetical protein
LSFNPVSQPFDPQFPSQPIHFFLQEESWETDSEADKDPTLIVLDPGNHNAVVNADPQKSFAVGSFSIPNPSLDQLTKIEKRDHATFTLDPETNQLFVDDPLPSRNGVFLNENRVTAPTKLCVGDVLHLGGEPEVVSGEQLTAWPDWTWKLVVEYEDPEAAAEILADRAEAEKEAQERAAEAAAAVLAAEKLASLTNPTRKGSIRSFARSARVTNPGDVQVGVSGEGGQKEEQQEKKEEGGEEAGAGNNNNADSKEGGIDDPASKTTAATTWNPTCDDDDDNAEGAAHNHPWWKRHRNPGWPMGIRTHEQSLVMQVKRDDDDEDNDADNSNSRGPNDEYDDFGGCAGGDFGSSGGSGGGRSRGALSRSRVDQKDALGAGWVEEPDDRPLVVLDVGLCIGMAGKWLQLWELGRLFAVCWHLSNSAGALAEVSAVSMRGLGEGLLPKASQKLRDAVFRCRARRKDWGVHSPQRVPEGGWFPALFVDAALTVCGKHFGNTLTSLDLSGGVRLTAVALESLVVSDCNVSY